MRFMVMQLVKMYALRIENVDEIEFSDFLPFVSKDKRERILRFARRADAVRSLMGDVLARMVIARRFSLLNQNIHFRTNKYGKPFVQLEQAFHFNLSHSGSWVVLAVDDLDVGVDIETMQPIDLTVGRTALSADEYDSLMKRVDNERIDTFYTIWTGKESYAKAVGTGLSTDFKSFSVRPDLSQVLDLDGNRIGKWCLRWYDIDALHKVCVCAHDKQPQDEIVTVDISAIREVLMPDG